MADQGGDRHATDYMTAAVCVLTGNQPASARTAAVRALQSEI
jgi:hypothetical protein